MIRKIVSCGTGGVAGAARNTAEKMGVFFGGCDSGETPSVGSEGKDAFDPKQTGKSDPSETFRRNVLESDATVLVTRGASDPQTDACLQICRQADKPFLNLDLKKTSGFHAARRLSDWVEQYRVEVLHVAGLHPDEDRDLASITGDLLEAFFYLNLMKTSPGSASRTPMFLENGELPRTVADAVELLKKHLRLKDKTTVANMAAMELSTLDPSLGEYIRNAYRLWGGNQPLLDSCRWLAAKEGTDNADPAMVIIQELWNELRKTHTLRLVK